MAPPCRVPPLQELEAGNRKLAARCEKLEHTVASLRDSDAQMSVCAGARQGDGLALLMKRAAPTGIRAGWQANLSPCSLPICRLMPHPCSAAATPTCLQDEINELMEQRKSLNSRVVELSGEVRLWRTAGRGIAGIGVCEAYLHAHNQPSRSPCLRSTCYQVALLLRTLLPLPAILQVTSSTSRTQAGIALLFPPCLLSPPHMLFPVVSQVNSLQELLNIARTSANGANRSLEVAKGEVSSWKAGWQVVGDSACWAAWPMGERSALAVLCPPNSSSPPSLSPSVPRCPCRLGRCVRRWPAVRRSAPS